MRRRIVTEGASLRWTRLLGFTRITAEEMGRVAERPDDVRNV